MHHVSLLALREDPSNRISIAESPMNPVQQRLLGVFQSLRKEGPATVIGTPDEVGSELIDGRIEIHDRHHFEVKLDYSIDPGRSKNRYRVEAYFFTPTSLGISPETYPRKRFYNDIQAYIRFKTPAVSLATLLLPDTGSSPLARLEQAVPALVTHPQGRTQLEKISYEMRFIGCLVRAHLRDRVARIGQLIEGLGEAPAETAQAVTDIRSETARLVAESSAVMARYRALRAHLLDPVVPAWVRETHEYVDEYLGLINENYLSRLVLLIDENKPSAELLADARNSLRQGILAEQDHRGDAGYQCAVEPDGGMLYVFRRGLLKKFVMSVLFLEISKDQEGRRLSDLFSAVAAGIAMLVATVGGVWVQQRYLATTWPFIATIVLLYMLKDRLKEWLRSFFSRKMTRFLADYSVRIRDSNRGLDIGRCREAFMFLRQEQVPPEIFALRHRSAKAGIEPVSKPETVIKYEKEITLDGKVVDKLGGLHHEINDIIRFNIAHFLVQADDPVAPVMVYRRDHDRVEEVLCPKVYHLNVVFVLRAEDERKPPLTEHIRVVIDKRGIRSLEHRT